MRPPERSWCGTRPSGERLPARASRRTGQGWRWSPETTTAPSPTPRARSLERAADDQLTAGVRFCAEGSGRPGPAATCGRRIEAYRRQPTTCGSRARRRRPGLHGDPGGPGAHAGRLGRGSPRRPSRRWSSPRPATSGEVVRGTADMWVGAGPRRLGARRHRGRGTTTSTGPPTWARPPACHSSRTGGGWRWRTCGERRATWPRRTPCSTEADACSTATSHPNVRPVPAVRARLRIRAGDLAAARGGPAHAGWLPSDDVTYLREYEHVTLARLLLAEHADATTTTHAVGGTRRCWNGSTRQPKPVDGRGSVVESLVLRRVARDAAGGPNQALYADCGWPSSWLEPRDWVRPFMGEGPRVRQLLDAPAWTASAFARTVRPRAAGRPRTGARAASSQPRTPPTCSWRTVR